MISIQHDVQSSILDMFNVMIVPENRQGNVHVIASHGLVLDFIPTDAENRILCNTFKPLDMNTLFTKEERTNGDVFGLITKQILHYMDVNGPYNLGLQPLTVDGGKIINIRVIRGVNRGYVVDSIRDILRKNAPVKNAVTIKKMMDYLDMGFYINDVKNNELRVLLFDSSKHRFSSGDDAVRWLVFKATGDTLLIKSSDVIEKMTRFYDNDVKRFLTTHEKELATVFNRHKKLLMAMKSFYPTAINRISRLSKKHHVPLVQDSSKSFLSKPITDHLKKYSNRTLFRLLNVIAFKKLGLKNDFYVIRNGKVHVNKNPKVYPDAYLKFLETSIINELRTRIIGSLKDMNILLDPHVDYGLPVSQKQTLGRLSFGTTVNINARKISSGVYWRNEWGARDIDLSAVDVNGQRVGWGAYSGYADSGIIFSGDVVNASDGAMEFFNSFDSTYALMANIFNGKDQSGMEIVVGSANDRKTKWINDIVIRERIVSVSKSTVIGVVNDRSFVVWSGATGGNRVSRSGDLIFIPKAISSGHWTISKLLDVLGVKYSLDRKPGIVYNVDLSYENYSLDKLENLLGC